ncbi:phosphatase PAP2 family protein [Streptomyces acidicola]|uniref:Phosphatase PAP2 family protein n=1 Tax=Streptomyces acidicola TaxID=2596892 RepID=A0A5N8WXU8_9ACTN|nr:phosphatase PAP2 family protein [Streptomyces acidicola]MPY51398.1 phosphatase PAP2 family protein [Streptomyces acidicola]
MNRRDVAELAGSTGLGTWTAFAVLAMSVVAGAGQPLWPDPALLAWAVGHRPEIMRALARGVTATGTGAIPYVLVALAGALVGRTVRQRLLAVAFGLACLATGQALRYGVMELLHRPRPPQEAWTAHASGWAFPSGHSTTAALTAGLLILALTLRAPRGGTALRVAVGCWGLTVGLTRVYLGVHWFTDVVGGWLLAAGWLGVCVCAAAYWLPKAFRTEPADSEPEDGTPQDPGREGGSRPA